MAEKQKSILEGPAGSALAVGELPLKMTPMSPIANATTRRRSSTGS